MAANGLQFPGTQSPSADANTLDDYEEGTFTPTWTNLTVGNSPNNAGYYTKIGRQVHVKIYFQLGSTSAMGTTPYINNLPFLSANNNSSVYTSTLYFEDFGTLGYIGVCTVENNSSIMGIQSLYAAGTFLTNASISSTSPFTWTTNDYFAADVTYMT